MTPDKLSVYYEGVSLFTRRLILISASERKLKCRRKQYTVKTKHPFKGNAIPVLEVKLKGG